jgi:hypothetical protein
MTRTSFSISVFAILIGLLALGLDFGSGHGVIPAGTSGVDTSGTVAAVSGAVSAKEKHISLYGADASPFGYLDCRSNPNTSACNPDDAGNEATLIEEGPLIDSLVKNQSVALISGNYSGMKEFTSSAEVCADFPAAAESAKRFDSENSYGGSNDAGCDVKQLVQFMQKVKDSVFAAAQSGSSAAQVAYGDLLEYELRTAVVSMSHVLNQEGDATALRLTASAKQSEIIAYAKSTIADAASQRELLAIVSRYQLESNSLQ